MASSRRCTCIKAAVSLIENPEATTAQLLDRLKGPDFPLGGKVVTDRTTLRKIYEEGTGSIKVQAEWKVEQAGKQLDSRQRTKEAHWVAGRKMLRMLPIPEGGRASMESGPVRPSLPEGVRGQGLPFNQMPNLLYSLPEQESEAAEAGK